MMLRPGLLPPVFQHHHPAVTISYQAGKHASARVSVRSQLSSWSGAASPGWRPPVGSHWQPRPQPRTDELSALSARAPGNSGGWPLGSTRKHIPTYLSRGRTHRRVFSRRPGCGTEAGWMLRVDAALRPVCTHGGALRESCGKIKAWRVHNLEVLWCFVTSNLTAMTSIKGFYEAMSRKNLCFSLQEKKSKRFSFYFERTTGSGFWHDELLFEILYRL